VAYGPDDRGIEGRQTKGSLGGMQVTERSERRRRARKGDGSVYRRGDGLWVGQMVRLGQKRVVYAKSFEEARKKLAEVVGGDFEGPWQDVTVAEWADTWLDSKQGEVRPTTLRGYRQILHDHIVGGIGGWPIAGPWTGMEFESVFGNRSRARNGLAPMSRNTRHNIRNVLHQLFEHAVLHDRVEKNPVDHPFNKIKGRSLAPTEIAITWEDARRIVEAVRGSSVEAIVCLALYTGARQGELLALRWRDLRLSGAEPHVWFRRTVTRTVEGWFDIGEPKTRSGRRRVTLNAEAVQLMIELSLRRAHDALDTDYVFASPRHPADSNNVQGRPYSASHVYHQFQRCLARAGLDQMRFHDLRHVAASLMLASGFEIPVVSRILGHSTPAITAIIYAHAVPGREREAVQALRFQRRGAGADERARLENG
jgi:integrase